MKKKLMLVLLVALVTINVKAATIVVTNTNDSGPGSLRDAVSTAVSGDTIRFSPSLISAGSDTISLQSGISINKGLFIKGLYNNNDTLYIKGNGNSIFILSFNGVSFPRFELDSMVLFNASSAITGTSFPNFNTDIRVNNSIIRNCSGSGIFINSYQIGHNEINVTINHSIIYDNIGASGGAIYMNVESHQGRAKSILDITNSHFYNNSSSGNGGAVYMYTKTGVWGYRSEISCGITTSTFNYNAAGNDGGGIYAYAYTVSNDDDAKTNIDVSKSTFINNSAVNNGGAIYARMWGNDYIDYSRVYAYYSTFWNNSANTNGASIYNQAPATSSGNRAINYFKSSIVAFNTGSTNYYSTGSDNISGGYNIFSNTGTNSNGNQFGVTLASINLGPLQNNGGVTPTVAPSLPSIAIDMGDPSENTDAQNGPILGRRDVGAAESDEFIPTLPIVSTNTTVSNITPNTAQSGGNVTNDGGTTVTARGVCWSTSQNPTISEAHTTDGTGIGGFTSNITNLSEGTSYYVRAYATNSTGTAYGNQISFTTSVQGPSNDECASAITLTQNSTCVPINGTTVGATQSTTAITCNGYTGTANDDVWFKFTALSTNPTIRIVSDPGFDAVVDLRSGSCNGTNIACADQTGAGGTETINANDLVISNTYYIRVYGYDTASVGTFTICVFDPTSTVSLPTVSTNSIVNNITQNTAESGGNVTDDGGATVTARGVCWSTSQNPTISGAHTTDGTGTGSFISNITGLVPGTIYYVRAYATNSAGTDYGNQMNFATITTNTIENTSITSFLVYPNPTNGEITIEKPSLNAGKENLKIFNAMGKLVYQQEIPNTSEKEVIDLSHLPNGLYYIRHTSDDIYFVQNFLIQK